MLQVKVWLGGEGASEIGDRDGGGERRGAIEALLVRIEASGWRVAGATRWQHIRKYKARAGIDVGENHGDIRNVLGLVLAATEQACELVAFARDRDADDEREKAVLLGIAKAKELYPQISVMGGMAKPALEGWILAMIGEANTDEMSRARTVQKLGERGIEAKSAEAYVAVVEEADLDKLPNGCDSLRDWIELARTRLDAAIHGTVRDTDD